MPVCRIVANPNIEADVGRVALRRGPIVYCLEGVDNNGSVRDIALPRTADLKEEFEPDLLGGVVMLRAKARRRATTDWEGRLYQSAPYDEKARIVAVPYYAWDHREPGEMVVWLPEITALADGEGEPQRHKDTKNDWTE